MLKNYLIVAWRNLFRNRTSSLINIGGLAAGMAVALLIGLWIHDEYSYNNYHRNYDRIALVQQVQTVNGRRSVNQSMAFPVGPALRSRFGNDFKYVVMSSWPGDKILTSGDKKILANGIYMDKDAPAMLSLSMREGGHAALNDPHSILVSASTAKALFGNAEPIGKNLRISNQNRRQGHRRI